MNRQQATVIQWTFQRSTCVNKKNRVRGRYNWRQKTSQEDMEWKVQK